MSSPILGPKWDSLVRTIAAMVTLAPEYVVVQVHGDDGPNGGPYVQTLREEDGWMTLEAAHSLFLDVPLSEEAVSTLLTMGWNEPIPDDSMPNYFRMIGPDFSPRDIAEFLVLTLRDAYGVTTSAVFEMAPLQLFTEVVHGDFGPPTGMVFYKNDTDPREVGF